MMMAVGMSLVAVKAFAFNVNQSTGRSFTVVPSSIADDNNIYNMCNDRIADSQKRASAFDQAKGTYVAINGQVVQQVTPGAVDPYLLGQCQSGCDANEVACNNNVGSNIASCYTDSNNNFVCPVSQISGDACNQFTDCRRTHEACRSQCIGQSEGPASVSRSCQISVSATQQYTLIKTTMNGHDTECSNRIKADQLSGNVVFTDEYHQAGKNCNGEEIQVIHE